MENYVNLVSNTFLLVIKNRSVIFSIENPYGKDYNQSIDNDCGCELNYKTYTFDFEHNYTYEELQNIFYKFTLSEMRDVLYQLVPFATNWVFTSESRADVGVYVNTLPHVKMAIKYVESAIV